MERARVNRRAVNLHRCAQAVVARGGFPRQPEELQKLPGIGPYTAAAIACFAFGAQIAAPDTNARRVLERAFPGIDVPPPPGRAYDWNQALFDLGREICIARTPRCGACPLAAGCPSRADLRTASPPDPLRGLVPAAPRAAPASHRRCRASCAAGLRTDRPRECRFRGPFGRAPVQQCAAAPICVPARQDEVRRAGYHVVRARADIPKQLRQGFVHFPRGKTA